MDECGCDRVQCDNQVTAQKCLPFNLQSVIRSKQVQHQKKLGPLENNMKKKDRVERICDIIGSICLVLSLACLLAIPVTYELWLAGVIK